MADGPWSVSHHLSFTDVKYQPRRKTRTRIAKDPWRRFEAGLGVLALVLVVGTGGYVALGLTPLDAFYQTVITISTVGFREVGDVAESYQVFTVFLILFGAGTSLYTLGVLIETIFEGRLDDQFRRRRMQRRIDRLRNHVVLCGYGQVGRAIERELIRAGREVVIIDRKDPDLTHAVGKPQLIVGDATDDHILVQAGLAYAKTLIVALDSDVGNLFIALTARYINPDIFVVARANESATVEKLKHAGADRVVNPDRIGGAQIAALVSHPDVAEFVDIVMYNGDSEVRLADVQLTADSVFADRSLADCDIRSSTGASVLAVRRNGSFITNPSRNLVFRPDDLLICFGTVEQLKALRIRSQEV